MRTEHKGTRANNTRPRKRKRDTSPCTSLRPFNWRAKDYEHEPLKTKTSIRILELQPGEKRDPVQCQLSVVERDQAPPYEAISYVWGKPTNTRLIGCGGRKLKITVNLRDALLRIRDPSEVKFLWADAVCINQSDEQERGHQVKHMGSIYANAERVLVWLGSDDFTACDTCNDLGIRHQPLSALVTKFSSILDQRRATLGSANAPPLRVEDLDHDMVHMLTSVAKLFKCSWFTRLWIVQEVGVGKSVLAVFGDAEMDFDDLMTLTNLLMDESLLARRFSLNAFYLDAFSIFPIRFEKVWSGDGRGSYYFDFLDVLEMTRDQIASDPRDRVYALLGHPSALIRGTPIVEPDYIKSAPELFFEVAVKLIEETRSLRVMSAVHHRAEDVLEEECPSWIPTWSRDALQNALAVFRNRARWYDAAAGVPAAWNLTASRKIIHVHGFVLDAIDEYTSPVVYYGGHPLTTQQSAEQWPIEAAMRFTTRSTYTVGEKLSELGQTLTAGLRPRMSAAGRNLSELPADFAAFRLHLIKRFSSRGDVSTSGMAPEGLAALREAAESGDDDAFFEDAQFFCRNRKLFSTRRGMLGLGPGVLREGDFCCILFGASVPFVLRRVGSQYRLVGEAYVQGVMHGEAMVDWMLAEKYQEQVFDIF